MSQERPEPPPLVTFKQPQEYYEGKRLLFYHYSAGWVVSEILTSEKTISVELCYADGPGRAAVETMWLTQENLDRLKPYSDPSVADWVLE